MVNCNPETVSTDYDVSDRLYFEPLTLEDVLNVYKMEEPEGVFLEFGGQTPLKLAMPLCSVGVRIMGTPGAMVDAAEDRKKCSALVSSLGPHGVRQPPCGTASSPEEAAKVARSVGYPVLLRPSYVLGGRAMRIVYCEEELLEALSPLGTLFEKAVLIDAFLEDAVEVDVDAVSDGRDVLVGAVMEHIELAGVHSGDSACVIPPRSLSERALEKIEEQTKVIALAFGVVGLVNLQFAVKGDEVYLLEVNPRASRTVPFASKATGIPMVRVATRVMLGQSLREAVKGIGPLRSYRRLPYCAVKEAVLPFVRFSGTDITLGPEMRSTGEVMGIDVNFGTAFAKSQMAAGAALPTGGVALITVCDRDKPGIVPVARALAGMGFELLATEGTATALRTAGLAVLEVKKIGEGKPDIIDALKGVSLLINTPVGSGPRFDECRMRRAALSRRIPVITTIRAAEAAVEGIRCVREGRLSVKSLQEYMRMRQQNG